jgi:hypothetical protein
MIIALIISVILNLVAIYALYNTLRKVELYEEVINEFYSRLSITLHTMRRIDERQLFESDDEVGDVFRQLTDAVDEMRPLLYGTQQNAQNENN